MIMMIINKTTGWDFEINWKLATLKAKNLPEVEVENQHLVVSYEEGTSDEEMEDEHANASEVKNKNNQLLNNSLQTTRWRLS